MRGIRKRGTHASVIASIALTLMLMISLVPMGVQGSAQPVVLQEGDGTAMGMEMDLGSILDDNLDAITDLIESMDNVTLDRLELDGEAGAWMLYEVTDATSTEYVVELEAAMMLDIDGGIEITGEMYDPGEYSGSWYEDPDDVIPRSERTVSVDVDAELGLVIDVTMTLERSTLAVESIDIDVNMATRGSVQIENMPDEDEDWEWDNWTMSVSYDSYDISWDAVMDLSLGLDFDPAMDMYQFPFDVYDQWTVSTDVTIDGTMDGYVDIRGLPEDVVEDIFSDEVLVDSDITEFPIEFEALVIDEGDLQIADGVMEPVTIPVEFDVECIDMETLTIDDQDVQLYLLEIDEEAEFLYASNVVFLESIAAMEELMEDLGGEELIDLIDMMEDAGIEMEVMGPDEGQVYIDEAKQFEQDVAADANADESTSDDILDFFLEAPYYGIIMVAIFLLVIVAFVALRRR